MIRLRVVFMGLALSAGLAAGVRAQEVPPVTPPADSALPAQEPARGPADLIRRANEPSPADDLAKRAGPAPTPAPQPAPSPHANQAMFEAPRMASAAPDPMLPVGTIEVEVRNAQGMPVRNADVQLGVMAAQGTRETNKARTDAQGRCRFSELSTGASQAYRINLLHEGAKTSSTPFRLPDESGYRVRVAQSPVTHDRRLVFQMVGQAMVELRDDRLHITQQSRLTNAGREVYVFPESGELVKLPEGFISFQAQKVMTDQRIAEKEGEGFTLKGSLQPGTVTLAWSYDLKLSGSEARIPVDVPWRTYMFRVLSDAPDGLDLSVRGMPDPQRVSDQGRNLWVTQVQKSPEEAPLKAITLRLTGIPGPGPGRWVAVALALLAVLFGAWAVVSPGEGVELRRKYVARRRADLLEHARQLQEQKQRGEIGPEFYAQRSEELTTALAVVLRDEQLLDEGTAAKRKPSKATA